MPLARAFCLLTALVVAACGPLPRAFVEEDAAPNPLTLPSSGAVLTIQPLASGSSGDDRLAAQLLAEELQRIGLPATAGEGHRGARRILGRADVTPGQPGGDHVALEWLVLEGDGTPLGRHAHHLELPPGLWGEGTEEALRLAVQDAAPAIAEIVQPAPVAEARLPGWPPGVTLVVAEVTEGPADSAKVLGEALREALRARDLPLRRGAQSGDIIITGRIETEAPVQGQQPVAILWEVTRDGRELGDLEQANVMPAATVQESWAPIARQIAEAAVPGLEALLREAAAEQESAASRD